MCNLFDKIKRKFSGGNNEMKEIRKRMKEKKSPFDEMSNVERNMLINIDGFNSNDFEKLNYGTKQFKNVHQLDGKWTYSYDAINWNNALYDIKSVATQQGILEADKLGRTTVYVAKATQRNVSVMFNAVDFLQQKKVMLHTALNSEDVDTQFLNAISINAVTELNHAINEVLCNWYREHDNELKVMFIDENSIVKVL